jgi:hypothetical protein
MSLIDRGVLYLSTGDEQYRQYTTLSIQSLRQAGYRGPVTVVSDQPQLWQGQGVHCRAIPQQTGPYASRFWKTQLHRLTPYRHTLFLDSDTLVVDARDLFKPAGKLALAWDVFTTVQKVLTAARKYRVQKCPGAWGELAAVCPPATSYFNSGVMLWRTCAATTALFNSWHLQWLKHRYLDQPALAVALQKQCHLTVERLPDQYNCNPVEQGVLSMQQARSRGLKILHFWGLSHQKLVSFSQPLR